MNAIQRAKVFLEFRNQMILKSGIDFISNIVVSGKIVDIDLFVWSGLKNPFPPDELARVFLFGEDFRYMAERENGINEIKESQGKVKCDSIRRHGHTSVKQIAEKKQRAEQFVLQIEKAFPHVNVIIVLDQR